MKSKTQIKWVCCTECQGKGVVEYRTTGHFINCGKCHGRGIMPVYNKAKPGYLHHLIANLRVAGRCLLLAAMHAIHGLLPCRITEHDYWGI